VHTVIVIGVGLVLLAVCLAVARAVGEPGAVRSAVLVFLPLWLAGTVANLVLGVKRAGYTVAEEAPIAAVVFAVPAVVALLVWWRLR